MLNLFQYFHPFEAKGYRKAVRPLSTIGNKCIVKRIKALDNGEEVPNDILTHILKVASKWLHAYLWYMCCNADAVYSI